jgi:membrane protein DedA with SNARE-associated domain
MQPELLLQKFGYLAVFVGTFLEGEAILVMAGFFAERGHLDFFLVVLTGFVGAYVGHIFWFWLGRTQGVRLLDKFPKMKKHFGKGIRMFERYGAPAIFITQWLYGLRVTCAVIIGISRISIVKFLIYEAITCAIWAIVIGGLGYYFGQAIEAVLGRVEGIEKWGLAILVAVALGFWIYHQMKEKKEDAGLGTED